jgi:hypothetical protein
MFKVDYNIIRGSINNIDIITDEELRYNSLLGNVVFSLGGVKIDMSWEWVPLLDFSFCLSEITTALQDQEEATECFEFTESTETLKFSKKGNILKILPSFSSNTIITQFDDFKKEVKKFRYDIISYIKGQLGDKMANESLKKYL